MAGKFLGRVLLLGDLGAGERTIDLRPTHSISGNPDRLRTGPVEIRLDDEWRTGMSRADHRFVTALTWPLLLRYGYLGRP